MNYDKYLKTNCYSLKNKTIAITGSTGGIGKEFAKHVINLDANLILIGRNINRLTNLKNELLSINKKVTISLLTCDFLDIEDVKLLCDKLEKMNIDYFIHNAGSYCLPKENTSLNYNNVFQINSIVPFYISKRLMFNIKEKFILVSSLTATKGKINKNDIQLLNKRPIKMYANSKKLELISLTKLFDVNNIDYTICHPGVSYTNITSNYKKIIHKLIKYPMKLLFISPKKASLNVLISLFNDCKNNEWIGPKYFNIWGQPSIKKYRINEDIDYIYNLYNNIIKEL